MRFMSDYYQVTAISSEPEYLKRVGQKEGVKVHCVEMTRQITPVADLKAVLKLYKYLRKERPQIVHTHTPKAGIVGMLAAKLAGVPHRLHTVAGLPLLETSGKKRKLLEFVEKLTYSLATKVYPNSFALSDILKAHGFCPPEKLKVLANGSSNGIDTSHFSRSHFPPAEVDRIKQQWNLSDAGFVFVFVGRLVKDKGINELVSAFVEVQAEIPSVKLLLVGPFEADLDPVSDETMAHIEHHPRIVSCGYQNDVRGFFAVSDALVFPSYREGFPNVVMQAGAMDLPAIVSDINGCNEIVAQGKNGLIVPVKNASALETAMRQLCTDAALYAKMRANARDMIVSRYEQRLVWDALLNEYKNLEAHV